LSFLLDTDICSAYVKGHALVFQRFLQYSGRLYVSTLTLGELLTWALRAQAPPRRQQDVRDFLTLVSVLEVTQAAAWKYGEIQAALLDAGTPAPGLDLFHAAVALVQGFTIVTHNVQDYANIPDLLVADWLIP
jgi:tRNA(fMet)-specific endonuclease VapC